MAVIHAVVLLVALFAGCTCGCATAFTPPADEPGLSLSDQEAITVKIYSCTGSGSGFLVSPRHVVTAGHVLGKKKCDELEVETADGQRFNAALDAVYRRDIARLELDGAVESYVAAPLASPVVGGMTCFTPGAPHRILTCGEISAINWSGWRGEVHLDGQVVKGNSGSPLWDSRGRLIGVVVTCDVFDGTGICLPRGGGASSFEGARWLVEDVRLR